MKTDEQVENMMKEARKKVFWRLYNLPWVILTTLLTFGIIYFGYNDFKRVNKGNKTETGDISIRSLTKENSYETNEYKRGIKDIRIEAVGLGYGTWVVNLNGEVGFEWVTNVIPTEEEISKRVEEGVVLKLKEIKEKEKKNQGVWEEKIRKGAYTESLGNFQKEAVSNGLAKWEINVISLTNIQVIYKWKTIPEIVKEYVYTESNMVSRGYNRSEVFTYDNYIMSRKIGIDLEGEILKGVYLGIESAFWGRKEDNFKEKVRAEITESIHGIFNSYETLNKTDKEYNIKERR